MIGTALLASLAVWLVVVLASRLSVHRSTSSGRGRDLAAALAFIVLLGMIAANPAQAHESHRPAVPAPAGEATASARGNPLARLDGPFDRSQGSLEVRRAGHALSEDYGYGERVRPVVARWVNEPAILVSSGEQLESGAPRSAKSTSPKYDATHLLRVWHQVVATETGINEAGGVGDKAYGPAKPDEAGFTERELKQAERAFRQNKDFQEWFHREYKGSEGQSVGGKTNSDLQRDLVRDAFEEWRGQGSPKRPGSSRGR